jgi:hypothetical protein
MHETLWREYERHNEQARRAYDRHLHEMDLDAQIAESTMQHGPDARPHRCKRPECIDAQRKYDRMRKALTRDRRP